MSRDTSLSLADLSAAGVRLRPVEAATIVRELAAQVSRDEIAGVPSAHVVRLSPAGSVFVEGPVAAGGRAVARAAQLLETLLPGFDAPPEFRAPGALRLVIARALGSVDLPPYATLDAFAEALERFAAPDLAPIVQHLTASWAETIAAAQHGSAVESDDSEYEDDAVALDADEQRERDDATERVLESFAPAVASPVDAVETGLTVSDVRRARRATGLTLEQVAERSRIPRTLLRELEWGLLQNWPSGHYGRIQLVRYARAAGLDEEVVVRAVWPLIDADAGREVVVTTQVAAPVVALVPRDQQQVDDDGVPIGAALATVTRPQPSRRSRVLAALAIPALLAVAVAPAVLYRPSARPATAPVATQPREGAPSASAAQGRIGEAARQTSGTDAVIEPPVTVQPTAVRSEPDTLVPDAGVVPARGTIGEVPAGHAEPAEGLAGDAAAYSPAFASVGSAMFYHAETDGRSALMRADTDSRGAVLRITRIVDDTARNFHARPSPDGTRIAFDSDREGERAVYVADAQGRDVRRITGEGFAAVPSWSPDGGRLAYVRAEPGKPRVWNLWVTDLESGASKRLTDHSYGQPWGGSWFPDGRRIAYSHEDRLIVLDLETRRQRVYPSPRKGRLLRTPAVSPDGGRVIFQVRRDGGWLLELRDGSMRKVLSDPTAEEFTWAPDGSRVAYHSRQSGSWGVWVMAPR